jgi:hypothetical protein
MVPHAISQRGRDARADRRLRQQHRARDRRRGRPADRKPRDRLTVAGARRRRVTTMRAGLDPIGRARPTPRVRARRTDALRFVTANAVRRVRKKVSTEAVGRPLLLARVQAARIPRAWKARRARAGARGCASPLLGHSPPPGCGERGKRRRRPRLGLAVRRFAGQRSLTEAASSALTFLRRALRQALTYLHRTLQTRRSRA